MPNRLDVSKKYQTVYIRSHFSTPGYTPKDLRKEIDNLVDLAKQTNPNLKFIDNMPSVDQIISFEDKWSQYELFGDLMPRTKIYDQTTDISDFNRPIFKKRLSSRGQGVTWSVPDLSADS